VYIVTFYSFKGGVGRSMALVNVATELARKGRRVLVVDLDLEAPGLHTFASLAPKQPMPGMVDFVLEYLQTAKSPIASQYAYKAVDFGPGELWVMLAGMDCPEYPGRLSQINWEYLYKNYNG
jgi:MinD-like ATPase involved in chromosome partitioning or flagellar assembly